MRRPFVALAFGLALAAPVARAEMILVPSLEPTARGAGGYGSTGRR